MVSDRLAQAGKRLALFKLNEMDQTWQEQPNSKTNDITGVVSVETMSFSYWTVLEVDQEQTTSVSTTPPPLQRLPKVARSMHETLSAVIPAVVGLALFCLGILCVYYPALQRGPRLLLSFARPQTVVANEGGGGEYQPASFATSSPSTQSYGPYQPAPFAMSSPNAPSYGPYPMQPIIPIYTHNNTYEQNNTYDMAPSMNAYPFHQQLEANSYGMHRR